MSQFISKALALLPRGLLLAAICSLLPIIYIATSLETASNDVFWHIKMGERFIEQPFFTQDTFSFTYSGKDIRYYPYLFETVLYYLDELAPYQAVSHIFLYTIYLLGFGLSLIYVWRTNNRLVFYLFAAVGFTYFYSQRLLVRPDLLYYPLIAIALLLYKQAATRFSPKTYLGVLAITIVWATYYTPIFLYVLLAGLYLDLAIQYIKENKKGKDWAILIASGAALLIVEFLPPFANHSLLEQLNFEPRWKDHIVEYWNIFYRYSNPIDVYPLLFAAIVSVGLAVKTKSYGYLLINLVFIIQSIAMSRIVPFAGYILVLTSIDMVWHLNREKHLTPIVTNVALIVVSVILLLLIAHKTNTPNIALNKSQKPLGLVNYYKSQKYSGNIFNDYNVGGYLIYHLYPESKVYIDGRTHILYDFPFFDHHRKILSNESYLIEEDEKYDIDFLVIDLNTDFFLTAYHTGRYQLDYLDKDFALFKKGSGALNKVGLMTAAPYCWNYKTANKVKEEISSKSLPTLNTDLVSLMETVTAYSESHNKSLYLNELTSMPSGNFAKRFLSYQFFSHGLHQQAMDYFLAQGELKVRDYLVLALSAYEQGNFDIARQAVAVVMTNDNMRFDDVDVLLLYSVIKNLNEGTRLSQDLLNFNKIVEKDLVERNLLHYASGDLLELLCHPELSLTGKMINHEPI